MRSLSIVAVALLGSALSVANAEQAKTTRPPKNQPPTLTTARGPAQVSALTGTHNPTPHQAKVGPTNGPSHHSFVSGGSDTCATATNISGPGPFNGDNLGASTDGGDPCGVLMGADVWYNWTAGSSGPVIFSLCGSNYDTSIAIYDTAACTGANLACNDDFCGLQSQTTANVVAGNVYKIQVGGFNASTGNYTLNIGSAPTCPCSGAPPEGEVGCGVPTDTFNGGCNSSPPVYSAIACGGTVCGNGAFNGSYRDTDWYQFTVTGPTSVTWTLTGEYGIVAGILDNNCPPNLLSFVQGPACTPVVAVASVSAGTYVAFAAPDFSTLITCGTNDSYLGALTCVPVAPPGPCDVLHDGSSENAVGFGAPTGTDILWMQRQSDASQTSTVVSSISTAWGTAAFPGNGPAVGSIQRIGIWQDTDNDGDPSTGLSLVAGYPISVTVTNVDNDVLDTYPLSPPVIISGTYFIGASSEGAFPSPLDQSVAGSGRSWLVGNNTGANTINYANLNAEPVPPLSEDNIAPGVWLLQAQCDAKGTISTFCFGDGSGAACPCNNSGLPGRGCDNSDAGVTGGLLSVLSGTASISANNLRLTETGHHLSSLAVMFQGTVLSGQLSYGDGLRCVGNPLRRIYILSASSSVINTPVSPSVAAAGLITVPGTIKGYYLAYRDPVNFCTSNTFNASNSLKIVWAP
jgi:hypothetical protein